MCFVGTGDAATGGVGVPALGEAGLRPPLKPQGPIGVARPQYGPTRDMAKANAGAAQAAKNVPSFESRQPESSKQQERAQTRSDERLKIRGEKGEEKFNVAAKKQKLEKDTAKVNAREAEIAKSNGARGEVSEKGSDGITTRRPKTLDELAPSFESQISKEDRAALKEEEQGRASTEQKTQEGRVAKNKEKYDMYQQELKDREYKENERMSGVTRDRQETRKAKQDRDKEYDDRTRSRPTFEGLQAGRDAFQQPTTVMDRVRDAIAVARSY